MSTLNKDILFILFEELQDDSRSLFSCLLVNRVWCETAIPVLWRNPWRYDINHKNKRTLFNIVTLSLSDDIKEILQSEGIQLSSTTLQRPFLFDYLSFCKSINVNVINKVISVGPEDDYGRFLLQQEVYSFFMKKCSELKYLDMISIKHQIFNYPDANTRLKTLCELNCDTSIDPTYFYGLARICKYIQRLIIINTGARANHGIVKLIEVQENLKYFEWKDDFDEDYFVDSDTYEEIFSLLVEKAHTLNHFIVSFEEELDHTFPPWVMSRLCNLQTLKLNFQQAFDFSYDEELSNSVYPNLEILQLGNFVLIGTITCVIKNTGGHVKKILNNSYMIDDWDLFNENFDEFVCSIYENCPLIEHLSLVLSYYNELNEFENLLKTCQKLSILLLDIEGVERMNEKEKFEYGEYLLRLFIRSAPISLKEIRFFDSFKISLEALETFLENWQGRPAITLITSDRVYEKDEYMKIINKYMDDGVIKDFRCVVGRELCF